MKRSDLIIRCENIFTGVGHAPAPGIIAVLDGKVQFVGAKEHESRYLDHQTEVIDYEESLIVPGFHDSHMHFYLSALYESENVHTSFTDLSEEECVQGLENLAKRIPNDRWLIGAGWYHPIWTKPKLPTKKSLDKVYPDRPVCMASGDAHTLWLNSCGLERLGLNKDSIAPIGGSYGKDENGELTGTVHEAAALMVIGKVYDFSVNEKKTFIKNYIHQMHMNGITSISDMSISTVKGADFVADDIYADLLDQEELDLRIHMFPAITKDLSRPLEMRDKYQGERLQFSGVKQFFDGVSSCHTAFLSEPYSNAYYEGDVGKTTTSPKLMEELVLLAYENDFATRVHTIGDQAIHLMLDFHEKAEGIYGRKPYLQHGLEHLENFQPEDIKRVAKLNILPAVQPAHTLIDPVGIERDLGQERAQYMWPFRSLLDEGATLAFGTDSPVTGINPMESLYNAVTRQSAFTQEPKGGWIPQEKITLAEAIRAYTYGSACSVGRSHELGTIAPGMFADFAVIDRNIFEGQAEEMLKATVVATFVDGKRVYSKA